LRARGSDRSGRSATRWLPTAISKHSNSSAALPWFNANAGPALEPPDTPDVCDCGECPDCRQVAEEMAAAFDDPDPPDFAGDPLNFEPPW
jgi:hypothetical protein